MQCCATEVPKYLGWYDLCRLCQDARFQQEEPRLGMDSGIRITEAVATSGFTQPWHFERAMLFRYPLLVGFGMR